ncbi:MAG TPA: ABC transporter ATP-binding protein [Candidatus Thermoplasmatota archaeon]|nr:ABC transporter ATP-binding protein [Candidatus Thermoplasmatota archaeon]
MPVVEVEQLVKRYGELSAVDGLSFSVEKGEVFALLGPNGAGKTTTVEILECLRAKTSGRVRVLGHDVETQASRIRERIGVLPQDFNTFDRLTVRENVRYFRDLFGSNADVDELLASVGLTEKADTLYLELSGGLKQRTGVAIALVNDPELVFLDEPSTGLDPHARRQVWELIRKLRAGGRTVFLTTHYMEEAAVLSDRVGIVHRGKLVALDAPDAIVRAHAGSTTVRLPAEPGLADRVAGWLPRARVRVDNAHLSIDPGDHRLEEVLSALASKATLASLEVRTPNLEDAFLALTGERLGGVGA